MSDGVRDTSDAPAEMCPRCTGWRETQKTNECHPLCDVQKRVTADDQGAAVCTCKPPHYEDCAFCSASPQPSEHIFGGITVADYALDLAIRASVRVSASVSPDTGPGMYECPHCDGTGGINYDSRAAWLADGKVKR